MKRPSTNPSSSCLRTCANTPRFFAEGSSFRRANQTPPEIVDKVPYLRSKYHLGSIRIVWYLARYHDIKISDAGVTRMVARAGPPSLREVPVLFAREGKQYLITSGMTGYCPNPSAMAVTTTFYESFMTLGDLHPADQSRASYKYPAKRDIALADRWKGSMVGDEFANGALSARMGAACTKRFAGPADLRRYRSAASARTLRFADAFFQIPQLFEDYELD